MKILYLVRHAKSSWKNPNLKDIDRPLNKRGERDAPLIGEKLVEKAIDTELIITSPAKRTQETTGTIARRIGYPEEKILVKKKIYLASANELLGQINRLDENLNSVMIFGHNPGLTNLNNLLTDRFIQNIPTCGVVAIQFNLSWDKIEAGSGKSLFFIYPKMYLK